MPQAVLSRPVRNRLDRFAIGLSALCLAHCLGSAVLLAMFSSLAGPFMHEAVHEVGLGIAILLGAVALGQGYRAHGRRAPVLLGAVGLALMAIGIALPHDGGEIVSTIAGVILLAIAHLLNQRATRCR